MSIEGGLSGDLQARATRLRTAIQNNLGVIQATAEKLQRLRASGQAMVEAGQHVGSAVTALGLQAAACATAATAAVPRAVASVSVSVEVSVSLSGSVAAR